MVKNSKRWQKAVKTLSPNDGEHKPNCTCLRNEDKHAPTRHAEDACASRACDRSACVAQHWEARVECHAPGMPSAMPTPAVKKKADGGKRLDVGAEVQQVLGGNLLE